MSNGHKRLIAQVKKAQREMALRPKSWREGLKVDLTILRASE